MKTNWKAIGIVAASVGALFYPAFRLYKYLVAGSEKKETGRATLKERLAPIYRGKLKAKHRHVHNGHAGHTGLGHA